MGSPLITPRTVTLGADSFSLLYEPLHWRLAERELGIDLMPPLATPFWDPYKKLAALAQNAEAKKAAEEAGAPITEDIDAPFSVRDGEYIDFLSVLLYVGLRHKLPKSLRSADAFNDWLAERVTWDSLNEQSGAVIQAVTDFFLRRVEAAAKTQTPSPETAPTV